MGLYTWCSACITLHLVSHGVRHCHPYTSLYILEKCIEIFSDKVIQIFCIISIIFQCNPQVWLVLVMYCDIIIVIAVAAEPFSVHPYMQISIITLIIISFLVKPARRR